jgi:hypothetical protein
MDGRTSENEQRIQAGSAQSKGGFGYHGRRTSGESLHFIYAFLSWVKNSLGSSGPGGRQGKLRHVPRRSIVIKQSIYTQTAAC